MKKKEPVIVFDGEDGFIMQKKALYSKASGKRIHAGFEGVKSEEQVFKDYMNQQSAVLEIPDISQPDFCSKALVFIQTNGQGKASSEQVFQMHQLYQTHCIEKPQETPMPAVPLEEAPVVQTPDLPDWNSLDCETLAKEIEKAEKVDTTTFDAARRRAFSVSLSSAKTLQFNKCQQPTTTVSPVLMPQTVISMDDSTFGATPSAGTSQGSATEEKPKNYNWLFLVGAVAIIYFVSKK